MNGAKICQQQIWGSRHYQITSYFVPTVMTGTLQLKLYPYSSFNSRFRVYYEVYIYIFYFFNEQPSNFEFVKRPVESSLSVCSML